MMETAISISDELLERADATARLHHVSRNELFARALTYFLDQRAHDAEVTRKLNEVYASMPSEPEDEHFQRTQAKLMMDSEW